jgi:hypothetical protein
MAAQLLEQTSAWELVAAPASATGAGAAVPAPALS